ncbi:phage tail fiber protein [Zooshikella ganghwensis]|uniref:phage tail fiber domain-containing protein n=1 Tax=Zooshikella ganghwensis TaxID=202772 RepID=UPI000413CAD5|nr:phage tail fiber protein [Zooshikella ganghwensis]
MNELKESLSQDINELGQARDTDITLLSPVSDKQYQLYGELLEKEADELENKTSYQQVATAAISQNWIEAQVLKQIEREDVLPSTDWKVTPEEYSQLIEGIPQDFHDEFNDARSLEHAFQIKGEIQDALKNREELMAHGPVIGIGASMVASVVDPVALGMTAATEGMAAPFLLGNKVSRLRRIISAGLINTTSAAVVEGTLANMDPTVDMDDVLLSMAGAFVLGSGVSAYRTRFDNAVDDFRKAIELDAIRKTGGELSEDGKKYYAKFLNEDGSIPTPEETASTLEKTLIEAEDILDTANEQLFYVAQEVRDYTEGILKMLEDGHFTALNRRIRNVADPEEAKDAVNLGFIQTKYLPQAKAEADRAANERIQAGNIYNSTVAVKNETQAFHDRCLSR